MPRNMTSRSSSMAPRASTCAASCTPWPPMPVMSTSRSMGRSDSCSAELHELLYLVSVGDASFDEGGVHAGHREVVHELDIAGVASERSDGRTQQVEQFGAARRDLVGELGREAVAVDGERSRRLGGL